jgi:hypothetical protein
MALRDRARRALAAALFPDLPPEAAAQAAAGLPGLEEAAARLADLLAFARPTPAREDLVRRLLQDLGEGKAPELPPAGSLERTFWEAHRPVWEPAAAAWQALPLPAPARRAAARAALGLLEEILKEPMDPESAESHA